MLFCTKTDVDEEYLQRVLAKEGSDGRYKDEEVKQMMHGGRSMFVNMHKDLGDLTHWLEKQTYLNIGSSLLAAGVLGLDALPMEGFDVGKMDKEFDLTQQGLTATALVAFGYKTDNDFNSNLPKSRLDTDLIFTKI